MIAENAKTLIANGNNLVFIRHMHGPYYSCHTKYNREFTDKLHGIPSWIWSKESGHFQIHYLDLPLLESSSAKGGYTVAYEPAGYDQLAVLRAEYLDRLGWKKEARVEIPSPRPFRNYQLVGAQFMYRSGRVLNADGMGCISGDAEIIVNRGGNARRYTLEQAYLRFNGLDIEKNNWSVPSYTRSLNGDHFSLNRIVGVVRKGVRKTLRITTESGREIVATPDHVFFTPKGESAIGTLDVGDELYVNGKSLCQYCGKHKKLTQKKFAGVCLSCVYRHFRNNNVKTGETTGKGGYVYASANLQYHPSVTSSGVLKHRLVFEAAMNDLPYDAYLDRLEVGRVDGLKFLGRRDVIHHKDGNNKNNHIDNLELTDSRGHGQEHGKEFKKHLWNVQGPKAERIAKIEDAGERIVYDVMMDDPLHSFVANGFVVHNSGKSQQAVGAVMLNKINNKTHKTLVVCPSSVKYAWLNEFTAVSDLKTLVLSSNMDKRAEQYSDVNNYDVLIIGFEGFIADYEDIATIFTPNILIVDECHRVSNRSNMITQTLIGGAKIRKTFLQMAKPHSIYMLTGTPISNKMEDLYAILRVIDSGIFHWSGFLNRYTLQDEHQRWDRAGGNVARRSYKTIEGYKNQEELKAKLSLHMIRRTKDEVLPELPSKVFQTIDIELGSEERKIYNDLRRDLKANIRGKELTTIDKLTWLTKAQQICDSLEIVAGANVKKSSKLEALIQIVNEQTKVRKIVIFSKFKSMTTIIARELAHLNPVHLNGDMPSEERAEIIKRFQNDDKCRVFISTIGAGGVGITLTAADLVVMYDRAWSPSANIQAIDRLHRLGQKNSVLVVTLRVRNSVEQHVEKVWLKKAVLINDMIGDEAVVAKMSTEELEELV